MVTKQIQKTHTDRRSYFQQLSAITAADLTNCIQQNPCSWSDSLSASQDIHCLLWNPEDPYRVNRAHASDLRCYCASTNKWLQHCSCLCQLLDSVLWVVYIKCKQVYMRWVALHFYVHLLRRCREMFVWEVDIKSSYIWVSVVNVLINIVLYHSLILFILVINQLDAKNLFYNKFISCLYIFRAPCAHRQEVKIVLYSIWYHQTCRWPSRAQVNLCTGRPLIGVMIPEAV